MPVDRNKYGYTQNCKSICNYEYWLHYTGWYIKKWTHVFSILRESTNQDSLEKYQPQ